MRRHYPTIKTFVVKYRLPIIIFSLIGFAFCYMLEEKEMYLGRVTGTIFFLTFCITAPLDKLIGGVFYTSENTLYSIISITYKRQWWQ